MSASAVAAIGWGFSGVLANLTSTTGIVLTFYRCWLAAALLVVAIVASGRRISWALLRNSVLGGVLLGADMILFFSAIRLTSVAVATVIAALQPALVMFAAGPLVHERIDRGNIAWTAAAIAGVAVIVVGAGIPTNNEWIGDLLAIASLVAWTGYFLTAKRASPRIDALEYTAGVTIVAALTTTVVLPIAGQSPLAVRASDWLWIALLAVIPTGAHLLMNWAHHHLDVSISSVIGSANPIVAASAAYLILGQRLVALQVAGGIVGVVAIAVVAARGRAAIQP